MVTTSTTIIYVYYIRPLLYTSAAGKVAQIGVHRDHEPLNHPFMKEKVRSVARKVTIADVSPAGVVLHFDSGISVHYSSEFLWQNREVRGNEILPEPPPDE